MSDKIDRILEKVTQTQIAVAVMLGDVRKNCRDIEALQTNIDKARFHPPLTLHGRMGSIIGHRKKKP